MTRQDPADAPELVSREDLGPRHESVVRPPTSGPDVDGRAVGASGCASPPAPRHAAGSDDADPSDGVGARTQAQIDAEIASLGEVPMYRPSPPEPPDPGVAPRPPGSPHSSDPAFAWLYRIDGPGFPPSKHNPSEHNPGEHNPGERDPNAATVSGARIATPSATDPDDGGPETAPLRLDDLFGPRRPVTTGPTRPIAPAPAPSAASRRDRRGRGPAPRRRSATPARIALVAVVAVLAASLGGVAGYAGLGLVDRGALPGLGPSESAEPSPQPSTPSGAVPGQLWSGPTNALVGVGVVAGCVAAPARDGDGNVVRYDAANLLDQNPATAWRCDDDTSPSLTFIVPQGSQLAEVGLINGYTKTDGADDSGRYEEYPRVLQVRWHLPDGTTVDQPLSDQTTGLQKMRVPVVGPGAVRMEIVRLTNPGEASATREAVVVSEVYLGAPVG